MTQYGELGCIFWHNYDIKISHFFYKHTYIVSVEGSSIFLYIECLGGICSFKKFLKKWHNFSGESRGGGAGGLGPPPLEMLKV